MTTPSTADEPAPIRIVDCDQCGRTEEDVGAPLQACGSCTCAVYCSSELFKSVCAGQVVSILTFRS